MCLSFALLPYSRVEAAVEEPLAICVTGLAGGMLPRFIRHNFPQTTVDCVEIDTAVAEVAVEMLGLKPDGHLRIHVADGIDFLANAADETYDVNIIDVNASDDDKTLEAPPPAFVTTDFIKNLARTTKVSGLAVVNVLCQCPKMTAQIFARFRSLFHGRLCYLKDVRVDADENVIVFILNRKDSTWPPSKIDLAERVRDLERKVPSMKTFRLGERLQRDLIVEGDDEF